MNNFGSYQGDPSSNALYLWPPILVPVLRRKHDQSFLENGAGNFPRAQC